MSKLSILHKHRYLWGIAAFASLLAACGGSATATPTATSLPAATASLEVGGQVGDQAPEFEGIVN